MRRLASICLLAALTLGIAPAQQKKRVAVLNFDYSTVQSYVSQIFGTNVDVGKGVSDLLVEKLVQGGTFSVIERKAIDKILAEQNFSNSDRADPNTASFSSAATTRRRTSAAAFLAASRASTVSGESARRVRRPLSDLPHVWSALTRAKSLRFPT